MTPDREASSAREAGRRTVVEEATVQAPAVRVESGSVAAPDSARVSVLVLVNAPVVDATSDALGSRLQRCYLEARRAAPREAGSIVLEASLGRDGSVAGSRVAQSAGLPEHGEQCMRQALAESTFRAPSGPSASNALVTMSWTRSAAVE